MSDNLNAAINTLSEQTRKLDIALHYTHGDMERAKEMVAGTYKDIYAIKVRFTSLTTSGVFIMFFNVPYLTVLHVYIVVAKNIPEHDFKTSLDWKEYEAKIAGLVAKGGGDAVYAAQLKESLRKNFSVQMDREHLAMELRTLIEGGDEIALNHMFQKCMQEKNGLQHVAVVADAESISSIDMELYSTSSRKIESQDSREPAQKSGEDEQQKEPEENPLEGKDVKLLLEGSFILSPIKGKDVGTLVVGDRIRLALSTKNPKAIQVAKAFNAYDGERILPIVGRVVDIKHNAPGFTAYLIIAKGIYVKIVEEEENIKVALDPGVAQQEKAEVPGKGNRGLIILVVLMFLLLLLVGLIVMFAV